MAAVLTSVRDDKDKSALYLNECRRMGIKVLPPDVNESSANFTAVGTDIRFGLTAIRNVGANVVDAIVEARTEKDRYESFQDFLTKVPAVVCNKRTIESLIKAGAFDSLGHRRRPSSPSTRTPSTPSWTSSATRPSASSTSSPVSAAGTTVRRAGSRSSSRPAGVGEGRTARPRAADARPVRLRPPALRLERLLQNASDVSISALLEDESRPDGSNITIAGMITGLQRKTTKQGNYWAIVTVEDLAGAIECLFFPQAYTDVAQLLAEDLVVVVKGGSTAATRSRRSTPRA